MKYHTTTMTTTTSTVVTTPPAALKTSMQLLTATKRMDPFETLPVELSLLILKQMEPRSMVVSGLVSRSWRDLSNDEALWRELCEEQLGERDGHDMELLLESKESFATTWKEIYLIHAFHFKETRILSEEHRKLLATEWLDRDVSWKLQFRATRDGFDPSAFHQLCDNRGATVTVCVSTKGFVFGGYNPKSWSVGSRDPELRHSPDAFIFSMINPPGKPPCRMFPTKDPRSACSSNSSYGPVWGNGYDLGVFGFPNGRGRSAWCRLGATYTAPYPMSDIGNQHYFIGGNPRDFDLAEVEVYIVRRDLGRRRKKTLQRQEKMAEREKALKNSGWACSACTFINAGTKVQCGVCATPRGKSKLFASSGSGALHLQNKRTLSSSNLGSGSAINNNASTVGAPTRTVSPLVNQRQPSPLSPAAPRRTAAAAGGSAIMSPPAARRNGSSTAAAAAATGGSAILSPAMARRNASGSPTPARRFNGAASARAPGPGTPTMGRPTNSATPGALRRNASTMGLGAKGATRSSDALRRVVDDEGPAAMVRRMSRERDRDREAALAAATRMADVESSSKMAEDHRAEKRQQQLARQESRRRQLSRERDEASDLHKTTKGSQLRRQDSKRQGKGKEKLSDLLVSTDEASTEGGRKVTLRQKVKSPSSDDLTPPDCGTSVTDAPASSSSSSSSSPSSSASSMSATEEKKEKKKKKTTKTKASGASPTLNADEQAAKLGEDRRKKEKKKKKSLKKEEKALHGGSTIGLASGSGKSTTLRRKGHSGPTEVVPEDWKRFNRSVSDLSPRSMTAVSKSPRTTETASPSSTSSSVDKTKTKTKKANTTKTKGSQLLRSDEAAARPTIPTASAKRERSVRRERSRDEESDKKTEKRFGSKREKRSGSSSSSSSPQLPGDTEPKKIGTLRKLISVKPSIQFTKSEVSIAFRKRSKSGEKEKNIITSPKPSTSSISELRSSDSWGVRAQ